MEENEEGIYILLRHSDFLAAFSSSILVEIVRYPQQISEDNNRIVIRNTEIGLFYFDDLLKKNHTDKPLSKSNVLILDGNNGKIGFVVDHVDEVIKLRKSLIKPIIPLIMKDNHNMFIGIASNKQKIVTVLDHKLLYKACFQKQSGLNKEVLNGA
ncbi:MAG: hypothetical protein A2161_05665 [Candidatus Schekmanbacteria bacterium RBG_13_48_7]|uniref:CheW-like domain-containing protein n=1 Tax=Candidatus Schekmanbacteria bacterium RBG_13_48_7 TaxID=1817878 RepID=A0A1F7S370_9BACT|nr:MAG: hypothetical protein A2161_05665 [Candidatus Schekmanbacteria bacterium RBG_13_48_7]